MPTPLPHSQKDLPTVELERPAASHAFASHVIQCGHCRSFPHALCSIGQALLAKVEWEQKCAQFAGKL